MALQQKKVYKNNFGIDTSLTTYIVVENMCGNKKELSFSVYYYTDENKSILVDSKAFFFVPTLEGDNFIKQAYSYLKSLPEYADAIDC